VDNATPADDLRDAEMRARRSQTMGQRIVSLIAARNRTRPATSRKITNQSVSLLVSDGESPDVIRNLLKEERKGRLDAGIMPERLLRLARFFGVTPTFLRTGRDDVDALNMTVSPFPVGIGQPVISVTGGMGGGGLAAETTVEVGGISYQADAIRGEVVLPDFMLASLSHSARRNGVHWFDVAGDSMEPTLRGGDWIGVNIEDKRIGQGGIFALRDHSGTIIVKRLEYGDQPGRIDIISDNPRQHSKSELIGDITVIGRVIARITKVG
jgi:hypothetical protein